MEYISGKLSRNARGWVRVHGSKKHLIKITKKEILTLILTRTERQRQREAEAVNWKRFYRFSSSLSRVENSRGGCPKKMPKRTQPQPVSFFIWLCCVYNSSGKLLDWTGARRAKWNSFYVVSFFFAVFSSSNSKRPSQNSSPSSVSKNRRCAMNEEEGPKKQFEILFSLYYTQVLLALMKMTWHRCAKSFFFSSSSSLELRELHHSLDENHMKIN